MLRIEARNAQTPIEKKPSWIKTRAKMGPEYRDLKNLVREEGLHTVCQEAGCPNIFECWEDREATFLIGGDSCTRRCDFCQIESRKPSGYDIEEPQRVAESVRTMGLQYATITGVCRDDLADEGGAWLYSETIRKVHELNPPGTGVEMLAPPDFSGKKEFLDQLFETRPEVFAHNVETVPRIFKRIRPASATTARWRSSRPAATPGWSPSRTSSSAWARPTRKSPRRCRTCTTRYGDHHHHPVPAPHRPTPPDRSLGHPPGGVRRLRRAGPRDRVRRGHVGPVGPFVLSRRTALSSGPRSPRLTRAPLAPPDTAPATADHQDAVHRNRESTDGNQHQ